MTEEEIRVEIDALDFGFNDYDIVITYKELTKLYKLAYNKGLAEADTEIVVNKGSITKLKLKL